VKELAVVVSVQDTSVVVEVKRKAACEGCGRCGGRISSGGDSLIVEARPVGQMKPGDLVQLELPDSDYVRLSFLVYGLPLLSAALGYGIGWSIVRFLGGPQVFEWFLTILGFALSFVWLRRYDRLSTQSKRYMPLARPVERF